MKKICLVKKPFKTSSGKTEYSLEAVCDSLLIAEKYVQEYMKTNMKREIIFSSILFAVMKTRIFKIDKRG